MFVLLCLNIGKSIKIHIPHSCLSYFYYCYWCWQNIKANIIVCI